jgi:hypothetical protein
LKYFGIFIFFFVGLLEVVGAVGQNLEDVATVHVMANSLHFFRAAFE